MKSDPDQSDDRRIDFIIIGAQKAGTTALFEHLAGHRDIGLSDVKELHFFDDEARDWQNPDYGDYHRHFDWAAKRVRGEASPIYAYWPQALVRIKAYSPAIKLVMMLRDPVERAWSHWRMETARGVETRAFGWCIREGRQRLFDGEPWGHHRAFSYVERGFYGAQCEAVLSLFPRDQLLVLQADALRLETATGLEQLAGFLGVGAFTDVGPHDVHVGRPMGEIPLEDAKWLREVYAADQARLAGLIGG